MTEEQLEESIAADPDDVHEPIDRSLAVRGMPPRKRDIHIRIDEDVLDWFRASRPRLSDQDKQCAARLYGEPQARTALADALRAPSNIGPIKDVGGALSAIALMYSAPFVLRPPRHEISGS